MTARAAVTRRRVGRHPAGAAHRLVALERVQLAVRPGAVRQSPRADGQHLPSRYVTQPVSHPGIGIDSVPPQTSKKALASTRWWPVCLLLSQQPGSSPVGSSRDSAARGGGIVLGRVGRSRRRRAAGPPGNRRTGVSGGTAPGHPGGGRRGVGGHGQSLARVPSP